MSEARFILYADDDENDRFFLRRAFASLRSSYALRTVNDGAEAIHDLQRHVPALVLLDVKMPRCNGFDVLQWLRAQPPPLRDLPVIMLSSSPRPTDFSEAEKSRATGYFVKPTRQSAMLAFAESIVTFLEQPDGTRRWKCPPAQQNCRSFLE